MGQLKQPRLADIVAAKMRSDILTGRLKDGDLLPNQEALFQKYQVSLPALREAMRILETEGLITVRRGNLGGAIVHTPTSQRTADMIAMVLQARHATPAMVSDALRQLEPTCAAMCAARADRAQAIVPALRAATDRQLDSIDDQDAFLVACEQFHTAVVACCGNEALLVVIGSLQRIWEAHATAVWAGAADLLPDPDSDPSSPLARETRRSAMRAHVKLIEAIEAGSERRAAALTRDHLAASHDAALRVDLGSTIRADVVAGQ